MADDERAMPAQYNHCVQVYNAMVTSDDTFTTPAEDGSGELVVWEGHLTKLFATLNLAVPYYTTVTQHLKRMGCVRQLRRGGGTRSSQWELIHAPTEDLFNQGRPRAARLGMPSTTVLANEVKMLQQQVRDLTRRMNELEYGSGNK